jgi:hypothetical protein
MDHCFAHRKFVNQSSLRESIISPQKQRGIIMNAYKKEQTIMNLRLCLSLSMILVAFGCSNSTQPPPQQDRTRDEYAVWAKLLDTLLVCGSDSTVYLLDSTTFQGDPSSLDSSLPAEMIANFKVKNLARMPIQSPSSICPTCVLVSVPQYRYPFLEISRVAFSSDTNQALCYFGLSLMPGEGFGGYIHFKRINGKWAQHECYIAWIT